MHTDTHRHEDIQSKTTHKRIRAGTQTNKLTDKQTHRHKHTNIHTHTLTHIYSLMP
jgi:hypothetical protein